MVWPGGWVYVGPEPALKKRRTRAVTSQLIVYSFIQKRPLARVRRRGDGGWHRPSKKSKDRVPMAKWPLAIDRDHTEDIWILGARALMGAATMAVAAACASRSSMCVFVLPLDGPSGYSPPFLRDPLFNRRLSFTLTAISTPGTIPASASGRSRSWSRSRRPYAPPT